MGRLMTYITLGLQSLLITVFIWNYDVIQDNLKYMRQTISQQTSRYYRGNHVFSSAINECEKNKIKVLEKSSENYPSRMCTALERSNYMQSICKTTVTSQSTLYNPAFIKQPNPNVIIDDKHKVIYCTVQKSSSSTWLRLLVNASNPQLFANKIKAEMRKGQEDNPTFHSNAFLNKAGLYRMKQWLPDYNNYTKFIVIRHPLDRILSAYYDKICMQELTPWLRRLKQVFANKYPKDNSQNNCLASFSDFVHFITSGNTGYHLNHHWNPYATMLCDPCHVKYDHILRLETIKLDRDPILKKLGLNIDPSTRFHMNKNRTKQKIIHKQQQGNDSSSSQGIKNPPPGIGVKQLGDIGILNSTLLDKLMDYYKDDMKIFGYQFDKDTLKATCSMKMSTGKTCC